MKKSIISLLFFFAVCAFSPNIVFAQNTNVIIMGVSTKSLDFGRVIVGTTKTLTVQIQNSYSLPSNPLLISWNPINQPFSISPDGPFGILVTQSKIFTITFKPTAVTSYDQTNSLSNNALAIDGPDGRINGIPQLSIHFKGIGVTGFAVTTRQTQEKK